MIGAVYVSVRWNVDFTGSNYDQRIARLRKSASWERTRLRIWSDLAMPSLLRQKVGPAGVILLCDERKADENARIAETFPDGRFRVVTDWPTFRTGLSAAGDPDEKVMVCRMDSDDCYHPDLIAAFVDAEPEAEKAGKAFIQAMEGHAVNLMTRKIYRWNNPSPPFFCIVRRRRDLAREFPGAQGIAHHGKLETRALRIGGEPLFCVTINGMNICNRPASSWLGREVTDAEAAAIRETYGMGDGILDAGGIRGH